MPSSFMSSHSSCERRTFWLCELALFDARLEGLVEHGVELCLGSELDLVVGLDIFLDGLATVHGWRSQPRVPKQSVTGANNWAPTRSFRAVSSPATISLFEL